MGEVVLRDPVDAFEYPGQRTKTVLVKDLHADQRNLLGNTEAAAADRARHMRAVTIEVGRCLAGDEICAEACPCTEIGMSRVETRVDDVGCHPTPGGKRVIASG